MHIIQQYLSKGYVLLIIADQVRLNPLRPSSWAKFIFIVYEFNMTCSKNVLCVLRCDVVHLSSFSHKQTQLKSSATFI